jgi:hypothetical protein
MTERPRPQFRCLEYRFTVETSDCALEARLADAYSACIESPTADASAIVIRRDGTDAPFVVEVEGRAIGDAPTAASVVELLAWYVNRVSVERSGDRYLILHAAAVAHRGRGVVIAGESGSGKSTLAAALVARGASYLGDEATGVDPTRILLVSNPKPLGLQSGGFPLLAPTDLGEWSKPGATVAPALVVQPRFEGGAATQVCDLREIDIAALLADQSFNFEQWGARGLDLVAKLARECRGVRVVFGDAADACACIEGLVA